MSTVISSISSDLNAANNIPDCEKNVNGDAAAQTKAAAAAIESGRKAIDTIKPAPPEARPAAADVYIKGSNVVAGVVQAFKNAIGSVISNISNIIKGIFSAANAVKNVVGGAVSAIGSWFGGIFDATPEDAVPNANEGAR